MAQSADLPRFVISKVDDVTRSQEAEQQQTDSSAEQRSTDTPVNGNVRDTFHVSMTLNNRRYFNGQLMNLNY